MVQIIEEVQPEMPERIEKFTFHALPPAFKNCGKKEMQENFFKWGLSENMCLMKFRYEEKLHDDDIDNFLKSFFSSAEKNRANYHVVHTFIRGYAMEH